jgi:hypothetical protein
MLVFVFLHHLFENKYRNSFKVTTLSLFNANMLDGKLRILLNNWSFNISYTDSIMMTKV